MSFEETTALRMLEAMGTTALLMLTIFISSQPWKSHPLGSGTCRNFAKRV